MVSPQISNIEASRLIERLASSSGTDSRETRRRLADAGGALTPQLLAALEHGSKHQRWEVIKVFEEIADPAAAPALVHALTDGSVSVRWAAANALIALDRAGLHALFTALTKQLDSYWLREGAHHVLHVLKDQGRLYPVEVEVFEALEGAAPDIQTPWAAERALIEQMNRDDA